MGFRFYRRVKIAPGITLNFSKTGVSTSFGPRGAKVTVGRNGIRKTVGIPGTGMYYTDYSPWKKSAEPSPRPTGSVPARETSETSYRRETEPVRTPVRTVPPPSPPPPAPPAEKKPPVSETEKKLTLSFLDRIFMPTAEVHLIDGLKSFISGDYDAALKHLEKSIFLPDSAFFAGFILLSQRKFDASISAFKSAISEPDGLGKSFAKIGVSIHFRIPITDSVELHISKPDRRSTLFALCEAYQGAHMYQNAVDTLVELTKISPNDLIVKNSLAEIILEACPGTENETEMLSYVITLADGSEISSPDEASLFYYRGCAQLELRKYREAIASFTKIAGKSLELPLDLVCDIRYQRGKAFNAIGEKLSARQDFLWVENKFPNYKDVRDFI